MFIVRSCQAEDSSGRVSVTGLKGAGARTGGAGSPGTSCSDDDRRTNDSAPPASMATTPVSLIRSLLRDKSWLNARWRGQHGDQITRRGIY